MQSKSCLINGSLSIYDFFTLKQLKAQGFAKKKSRHDVRTYLQFALHPVADRTTLLSTGDSIFLSIDRKYKLETNCRTTEVLRLMVQDL